MDQQPEPQNPTPNKNCKAAKIIAIITSIIAIAGIVFGVYGMIQSQAKDQQISDLKTVKTNGGASQISLKEVRSLLDTYVKLDYNLTSTENNLFENGITEQYKYYLSLQKLDYANRITANHEDELDSEFDYEYDLTYDEINDAYHTLFGPAGDVQNQTGFWCCVPVFSQELNTYGSTYRCGGVDPSLYTYEILDYSIENEQLIVSVAYSHIFQEYTDSETKTYIALNGKNEEISSTPEDFAIRNRIDELPKYDLTFVKENDSYILSAIKKTN